MAQTAARIVSGEESEIHNEPHIEGTRITVSWLQARVEERDLDPETVARRHDISVARVYEALAYYHDNLDEMEEVEQRRQNAVEAAKTRSSLSPKDDGDQ